MSLCEGIKKDYKGSHIVFNLTGGFKSVQGFLQTLATLYADESIYIFETAKELLRIRRLPLEMAEEGTVRKNREVFRRLAMGLSASNTSSIPETLLMEIDGRVGLSLWGDIVWEQTKDKIYEDEIYPPPSEKKFWGPKFEKSIKGLPSDRLRLVNDKIDRLAKYLETGEENLSYLDFKPLKGNPCPPSTHEIDAWSDKDAKRIFGHYNDAGKFILDKLDKGFH